MASLPRAYNSAGEVSPLWLLLCLVIVSRLAAILFRPYPCLTCARPGTEVESPRDMMTRTLPRSRGHGETLNPLTVGRINGPCGAGGNRVSSFNADG
jgi:hypothetical protein